LTVGAFPDSELNMTLTLAFKGADKMLKTRLIILAAVIAYGVFCHTMNARLNATCGRTANPAACNLSVQAGDTLATAIAAGNGR
jgi:hypothetical protein